MPVPRLVRGVRIVPDDSGGTLIIKTGTDSHLLPLGQQVRDAGALLNLLDGSQDLEGIAQATGLSGEELQAFLADLRRFNLLDDDHPGGPSLIVDRCRFLGEPLSTVTAGSRLPVLLFGLGGLGLAVLRDLLRTGRFTVSLFDPAPIQAADVGPFYRPAEIGQDKAHVLWTCLAPRTRGFVRRIGPGRSPHDPVEATLAPIIDAVRAVVSSDQAPEMALAVASACRRARVPLLVADTTEGGAVIAPVSSGFEPEPSGGCVLCAHQHRAERDPFEAALARYLERRPDVRAGWRHPHDVAALSTLSKFVVLALSGALEVDAPSRTGPGRLIHVDLARPAVRLESVSPHHRCRRCYPLADGDLRGLRHATEAEWTEKYHADPTPPDDLAAVWQRLRPLVGDDHGIFRTPSYPTSRRRQRLLGFCRARGGDPETTTIVNAHRVVTSRPSLAKTRVTSIVTEGLDFESVAKAGALSLIEGLERLFALEYCDPGRIVHCRYTAVAADALDPRRFPLYASEQYDDPEFGLRRFDPDAEIPWVWGMALGAERPVLVPADLIYTSTSPTRIYKPTSNGAACHTSFHHAVLNGIYEAIERDALMIVWLNQLSMPRVELAPGDPDPFSARRSWAALAFDCELVDITSDLGIPVLLGLLRDRLNPDFLLVDPVASLDPETLLGKLYKELVQFCQPYFLNEHAYRTAATPSMDANLVVEFPDHLGFYQAREKHAEVAFLTGAPERRAFGDGPYGPPGLGVRQAIDELVFRLGRSGHEVIVVNCTVPLLRGLGLCAVKVLIPGLQALNAGHRYRVLGGRRVLEAPRRMGLADRDRTLSELNPWPHPFW